MVSVDVVVVVKMFLVSMETGTGVDLKLRSGSRVAPSRCVACSNWMLPLNAIRLQWTSRPRLAAVEEAPLFRF